MTLTVSSWDGSILPLQEIRASIKETPGSNRVFSCKPSGMECASAGQQCNLVIAGQSHWSCMPSSSAPFKCQESLPLRCFPKSAVKFLTMELLPCVRNYPRSHILPNRILPSLWAAREPVSKPHLSCCFLGPLLESAVSFGFQRGLGVPQMSWRRAAERHSEGRSGVDRRSLYIMVQTWPRGGRGRMGDWMGRVWSCGAAAKSLPKPQEICVDCSKRSPGLGINGPALGVPLFSVMGWSHDLGSNKAGPWSCCGWRLLPTLRDAPHTANPQVRCLRICKCIYAWRSRNIHTKYLAEVTSQAWSKSRRIERRIYTFYSL